MFVKNLNAWARRLFRRGAGLEQTTPPLSVGGGSMNVQHMAVVVAIYPNHQQVLVCPICGWAGFIDWSIELNGSPLLLILKNGPDPNVQHNGIVPDEVPRARFRFVTTEVQQEEEVEIGSAFADYIRNDLIID